MAPQATYEAFTPTDVAHMRADLLDVFPNQHVGRNYEIAIECPEFTSVCPMTGMPDFGTIQIRYIPDGHCLELKAFKYYLLQYRNIGMFYENVTNKILADVVAVLQPQFIEVKGIFTARGGISTTVTASHQKP